MRSSWISIDLRRWRLAVAAACLACCWLALPSMAAAQDATPAPSAPPPKSGVFESLGRWFDQSTSAFQNHLRGAKQRMDDLGDQAAANTKDLSDQAAKVGQGAADVSKSAVEATANAVGAVAKLPAARLMSGRERCAVAPNGAPDCITAAEMLCRKHGFSSGKSMDFTSAEECPASTLLGQTSRDECYIVTFISRAMCQ
jgi:Spy/CpxP family protein refolding chaperone